MRRITLLITFSIALLAMPAAARAADGDVTQRSCVSTGGTGGACTTEAQMAQSFGTAVSPDGKNVYVANFNGTIITYTVNQTNGKLTRLAGDAGCVSESPQAGCRDVVGLGTATGVIVSPDGKFVYTAGFSSATIGIYSRNTTTGRIAQLALPDGCVSQGGVNGCTSGRAITQPIAFDFSPDGKNFYAVHQASAITTFSRSTTTGKITQLAGEAGCVKNDASEGCGQGRALGGFSSQLKVSPDGRHLYGAAANSAAIVLFNRDSVTGEITQKTGTQGCISVDGAAGGTAGQCQDGSNDLSGLLGMDFASNNQLYIFGNRGIVGYTRASDTGNLTQLGSTGCMTTDASGGACQNGIGVGNLFSGEFSPDGTTLALISGSFGSGSTSGVVFVKRNASTGALSQAANTSRCSTRDGAANPEGGGQCRTNGNLGGYGYVAWHPNQRFLYAAQVTESSLATFERDFAPVCSNRSVGVPHNTTVGVTFSCTDKNGDALTYAITRSASAGQTGAINQGAASVFYSPFNGFSGGDSFDYRATANGANSNTATVSLSVAAPAAAGGGGGGGGGGGTTPPPPQLIPSTVTNNWLAFPAGFTKVTNLSVNNLLAGTTVRVTCKTKGKSKKKQKKGCPYKSKRFTASGARAKLNLLKPFRKKRIPLGTKITIAVTVPGQIGKRFQYTMRKGKIPKKQLRCISPDGKISTCS